MMSWGVAVLDPSKLIELSIKSRSRPASSGALLQIEISRLEAHKALQSESPVRGLKDRLLERSTSSAAIVAALELIPARQKASSTSNDELIRLAELYTRLCLERAESEVHVLALHNLAEILDHLNAKSVEHQLFPELLQLWTALPWNPISPSLSDAILRVSGCIIASMVVKENLPPSGLQSWGEMVADAGLDDKVCFAPFSHEMMTLTWHSHLIPATPPYKLLTPSSQSLVNGACQKSIFLLS